MDRVQGDLLELCSHFLQLLDIYREKGVITDKEYEIYSKEKKVFIHKTKSKPSS